MLFLALLCIKKNQIQIAGVA